MRVEVSAPGKVILLGEHSVVYEEPALAGAIDLRTTLIATCSHGSGIWTIDFETSGGPVLSYVVEANKLPWEQPLCLNQSLNEHDDISKSTNSTFINSKPPQVDLVDVVSRRNLLLKYLISKDFLKYNETIRLNDDGNIPNVMAMMVIIYLATAMLDREKVGTLDMTLAISSQLPMGSGLGSSASLSACLSAAFLTIKDWLPYNSELQRTHLSADTEGALKENLMTSTRLREIENWAFIGEQCLHNTPSGVDNYIATYGSFIMFHGRGKIAAITRNDLQPGVQGDFNKLNVLSVKDKNLNCDLSLLVVDTQQSRETRLLVEKVAQLLRSDPTSFYSIIKELGGLTRQCEIAIAARNVAEVGILMSSAQRLLEQLGVSHPKLERVVEISLSHALPHTKLTGAGGGGCAITLLYPHPSADQLEALIQSLTKEGFRCYIAKLGSPGLYITLAL